MAAQQETRSPAVYPQLRSIPKAPESGVRRKGFSLILSPELLLKGWGGSGSPQPASHSQAAEGLARQNSLVNSETHACMHVCVAECVCCMHACMVVYVCVYGVSVYMYGVWGCCVYACACTHSFLEGSPRVDGYALAPSW